LLYRTKTAQVFEQCYTLRRTWRSCFKW